MSFARAFAVLTLTLVAVEPVVARPLDQSRAMPKLQLLDPSDPISDHAVANQSVMQVATAGTTFFGGTFWAADSQRWEAYPNQFWTFDSGVGSSIVPPSGPAGLSQPTASWVNPYKRPGLHATMEGWIGMDNTYGETPYFRRVGSNDPRFSAEKCAGSWRVYKALIPSGVEFSLRKLTALLCRRSGVRQQLACMHRAWLLLRGWQRHTGFPVPE